MLALPIIDRILLTLLPDDMKRRVIIRAMALEGILGHMGTTRIARGQALSGLVRG